MPEGPSDVIVVGGGPVGLATAIGLAERGAAVRVLDRRRAPVDKACGEGIMPHGVEALERLGVDLARTETRRGDRRGAETPDPRPGSAGGRRFRGIRYVDGPHRVEGRFPDRPGLAVRRTILQRHLLERARGAGVEVEQGIVVRGLVGDEPEWSGVSTDDGERRARWIVGADGLRSAVRCWSGLDAGSRGGRFGVRRHYALEPWTDLVEVHWADGCEAYVTPVGEREVGVAMLWEGAKGGFEMHLARFPELVERLQGAEVTSSDRGAGPLERRVRGVARGRLALVGDASGYLDAITGEGLSIGFLQAEALAESLAEGSLGRYERAHRKIGRLPIAMTRLLLAIERRPALRRRVIAALAAEPSLFARLLEIHAGARRPSHIGLEALWKMGRGLAVG